MLTVAQFNALPVTEAARHLRACCGSSRWVDSMLARRPYENDEALLAAADTAWLATGPDDWDEAFAHHPRIGEHQAAAPVSATARAWSAGEQSAVTRANGATRAALAEANDAYQRRFGRIYIVCAAGRSADELLADLEARLGNDPERERAVAAGEQRKITALRLRALIGAREP
jgi:2-oxo-4-hydroxy-4-carboxy-5-ureidoimidazoline decarboxylase